MANFGMVGLDWQQRINRDRLRKYRTERGPLAVTARQRGVASRASRLLKSSARNFRANEAPP